MAKIANITASSSKSDRFLVTFEDGTEIKTGAEQIAGFGLYSGKEYADDDYSQLLEELSLQSAIQRAARMLGGAELSKREVEKRLIRKGEDPEIARLSVEWLESKGFINDREYANSIVSYYFARKYGKARIRNELFKRGIDREMWDEVMIDLDRMEDSAYDFIVKKLNGGADADDMRRAEATLRRRGFTAGEARAAMIKYADAIEGTWETVL